MNPVYRSPARVLILGAGGHGQVVANVLLAMQQAGRPLEPIGYLDDDPEVAGHFRLGLPVLGPFAALDSTPHEMVLLGIGNNRLRRRLYDELIARGEQFATAIHPSSVVNFGAAVGPGCVVAPLCLVGTAVTLGANIALNGHVLVGHNSVVGDHTLMGPNVTVGGDVEIGEGALIGMSATVMSQRRVGAWATVGAAALVTRDVAAGETVIGQPARCVARTQAATHAAAFRAAE